MQITNIQINHLVEPLGFQMDRLRISFQYQGLSVANHQKRLRIREEQTGDIMLEHEEALMTNFFQVDMELSPRSKYIVEINLFNDQEEITGSSFFETGKSGEPFHGKWLTGNDRDCPNTLLRKVFSIIKPVKKARLYMTGLGVYEATLDGKKIGEEFLAPGVTAYNRWVQVQTYPLHTEDLLVGDHSFMISLGDGWYKSRIGFEGGKRDIYGDQQMAIAELHLTYLDGTTEMIVTDETWQTTAGKVTRSGIYYGVDIDDRIKPSKWQPAQAVLEQPAQLTDRMSLPIKEMMVIAPIAIIQTPKGETVLDFGQNHTGWFSFYNREPEGVQITLETAEILQNGNFYRDNLREAQSKMTFTSAGEEKWVRPQFTFYGYRYLKVSGHTLPLSTEDFRSSVVFSESPQTGDIKTGHLLVDRFFENVLWGQRSNFLDIPTDCPQRDERLGWTGDAAVFSETAAYNYNVYPFFIKYLEDIRLEQASLSGKVPMYAPAFGNFGGGAAVWGDAVTLIPWQMYVHYHDAHILARSYPQMVAWHDWVDSVSKDQNLWTGTFQFGDWLSLDGIDPNFPTGRTDREMIASVYYFRSTQILAQTSALLNKKKAAEIYHKKSEEIRQAILATYLHQDGRLSQDTQTGYALLLHFDVLPSINRQVNIDRLVQKIHEDGDHLQTGFVGTPILCEALSKNGHHELAVTLFLQEDMPSWLYPVSMGATTIWERWDSVLPNGEMNSDGMNSLNHYSLGAVMAWAYKYILGIHLTTDGSSRHVFFSPCLDERFGHVNGYVETSYGKIGVAINLENEEENTWQIELVIPEGESLMVSIPDDYQIVGKLADKSD